MLHLSSPEVYNANERSWLDKLMKSKVDWFMAPTGWLMTRRPGPHPDCSHLVQKDGSSRSINQSYPLWQQRSTERTFSSCSLIIFEMITVTVQRPSLKAYTCTPDSAHFSLSLSLSLCEHLRQRQRILCVLQHLFNTCHSFNLCPGWMRSSARSCARKRYNSFREM